MQTLLPFGSTRRSPKRRLASQAALLVSALALPMAGVAGAQGQDAAAPASTNTPNLLAALRLPSLPSTASLLSGAPAALPASDAVASSSSSASDEMAPVAFMADPAGAADGSGQPPPYRRRRYGRPSYSDRLHNADGSSKIGFVAGGGFNVPVGSASSDYLKLNYRFEGGVGYNLSRKLGVMFQFDYDRFGLPGAVLANQETLYDTISGGGTGTFAGLDGSAHIWSFTLNPTFNFYQTEKVGAYAVVGGGFYHKVTNFTVPTEGTYCDPYYGYCYQYAANQTIDFYTSNAPGVTGGVGLTYKFSRFANERFFAEARYVHTFNQVRYGDPNITGTSSGTAYNYYPPNSNETSYIPITFGVRF